MRSDRTASLRGSQSELTTVSESAKALVKREKSSPAVSTVEAVAMSMQQRRGRRVERMAGVSKRRVDHIETMDGPEILNLG